MFAFIFKPVQFFILTACLRRRRKYNLHYIYKKALKSVLSPRRAIFTPLTSITRRANILLTYSGGINMSIFNLQPGSRQMDKGQGDAKGGSSVAQKDAPMTVGKWIGTLLLLSIPFCNVVCYIVWLFGGGNNRSRTTYIRASLVIALIIGALSAILAVAFGGAIQELIQKLLESLQQ